jgi:hypothetical protein
MEESIRSLSVTNEWMRWSRISRRCIRPACVWLGAESGNRVGLSGTAAVELLTGGWAWAGNKEAGAPTAGAEVTPRAAYSLRSSGVFAGNLCPD